MTDRIQTLLSGTTSSDRGDFFLFSFSFFFLPFFFELKDKEKEMSILERKCSSSAAVYISII